MFLNFNRKNTRALINASADLPKSDKRHLDWLLENTDKAYGAVKHGFRGSDVFVLMKDSQDAYKVLHLQEKRFKFKNNFSIEIYIVEDIIDFLDTFGYEELLEEENNEQSLCDIINSLKDFPSNGIISIQENNVYIYDYED